MTTREVLEDLLAEQDALDAVVAPLDPAIWALPTPSQGWTIAHQIAHLAYFDRDAATAIADPAAFATARDALIERAMANPDSLDDLTLGGYLNLAPPELLAAWRDARSELALAARDIPEGRRVEWYGPSMSAQSFLTARLMEAWAHGFDVLDALDSALVDHADREDTDRLRHIAHLGVVTRNWSYAVRGDEAPDSDVRIELTAPGGAVWRWGPEDASQIVRGPAGDFCAVVTQRRNVADTDLEATGEEAVEWMSIAQAFAGGPTLGPPPHAK